ncbi:DUF808 family protein [Desulfurobacterium atlanticum]|uniref:Inner membrane protein YedI n=1 Tax=Desulfurobacterium atlanticum TaxID=240169 RepID=A0A238YHB5_9BACT|nr:DUF808 family protein [Desulfurobacterium atlanticum]SNR70178.1 hypothetical protein SAMN06265340_103129 [Desulfurobacterium atlanticum]
MASGIFALLDDVATLLDDISTAAKIATKKTAGILGDDLAVNAEKSSKFASDREIPVLLEIIKGSFINKAVILPAVFLLNFFFPVVIRILLLIGGAYLAYEAFEKVFEFFFHKERKEKVSIFSREVEDKKIKEALITDFILSLEVIIIALSAVIDKPLITQIVVVTLISLITTVGVYGLVLLIVRMDDFGLVLVSTDSKILKAVGRFLIFLLPKVIKALEVIGTFAMFTVAGGIYNHAFHITERLLIQVPLIVTEILIGFCLGGVIFLSISSVKRLLGK